MPSKKPTRSRRHLRRKLALAASSALSAGVVLAFAPSAFAFFTPESSPTSNAESIDSLYKIIFVIAIVVFFGVWGSLGYALIKFRARRGKKAVQSHGNTRLELTWTLGAIAIVIALAIITLVKLSSIQDPTNSDPNGARLVAQSGTLTGTGEQRLPPNRKALEIEVIGRQFVWQYVYPGTTNRDGLGAPYTYEQMVVPTHTTVLLNIVSLDVVHSWWIPELGGKSQAVPGYHNYTWFKIEKPGIYKGQCANICGRGHALMIASVRAVPPAQYEAWLAHQQEALAEANAEAAKARAKLQSKSGTASVLNP